MKYCFCLFLYRINSSSLQLRVLSLSLTHYSQSITHASYGVVAGISHHSKCCPIALTVDEQLELVSNRASGGSKSFLFRVLSNIISPIFAIIFYVASVGTSDRDYFDNIYQAPGFPLWFQSAVYFIPTGLNVLFTSPCHRSWMVALQTFLWYDPGLLLYVSLSFEDHCAVVCSTSNKL